MNREVQLLINKLYSLGYDSFINSQNELILIPKINVYFRLEDVTNELKFKCKVLEWCSRSAVKGVSEYYQKKVRKMINLLLDTKFTEEQFNVIYDQLGNCVNHKLTIAFIKSNYDFKLLEENNEKRRFEFWKRC